MVNGSIDNLKFYSYPNVTGKCQKPNNNKNKNVYNVTSIINPIVYCRYTYVFPPKQVVCFEIYYYRLNILNGGGGGYRW